MDSDDDVPLTRTVEVGHIPLIVKRSMVSPTVGVPDSILLNRAIEPSNILTFPNSHEHYYTKYDNIISIMQSIDVECCSMASYSMLITEYLKYNSDLNILPIIWPLLRRTNYLIDKKLSNFDGIDIPTFLENVNSTKSEISGIFKIDTIDNWVKNRCSYACVSLNFTNHAKGHFIAYIPLDETNGYLLDPAIGSIHKVDIDKLIDYSIKHPIYRVTKDIICLEDGFNTKLDEYISLIHSRMRGAVNKKKKSSKKKKPSKKKKSSKKKITNKKKKPNKKDT